MTNGSDTANQINVKLDGVCDHPSPERVDLARGARVRTGVAGGEEVLEGETLLLLVTAFDARVVRFLGEGSGGGVGAGEVSKSFGWLRVATMVMVLLLNCVREYCGKRGVECDSSK